MQIIIHLFEFLEYMGKMLFRDTDSRIYRLEQYISVFSGKPKSDGSAGSSEFQSISQKIYENLTKLCSIRIDMRILCFRSTLANKRESTLLRKKR